MTKKIVLVLKNKTAMKLRKSLRAHDYLALYCIPPPIGNVSICISYMHCSQIRTGLACSKDLAAGCKYIFDFIFKKCSKGFSEGLTKLTEETL